MAVVEIHMGTARTVGSHIIPAGMGGAPEAVRGIGHARRQTTDSVDASERPAGVGP